ncbi:MAG: phosphopantothenoylcysteine decarboxylase, partial [Deltaproteobacteria bacterium]|nr:phosphopantothenoylcysteine decarboxylase [Deltaproteobacteria bacterium]
MVGCYRPLALPPARKPADTSPAVTLSARPPTSSARRPADVAPSAPIPRPTRPYHRRPTHEPIDAVRYLANRSSGKVGAAIASAAAQFGHHTKLLMGPVPVLPPLNPRVELLRYTSTADLKALLDQHFPAADILIMAAAVADFTPQSPSPPPAAKWRRSDGHATLELVPTPDLLAACAALRQPGQILVGFALEPAAVLMESARRKLASKRVDAIVANPSTPSMPTPSTRSSSRQAAKSARRTRPSPSPISPAGSSSRSIRSSAIGRHSERRHLRHLATSNLVEPAPKLADRVRRHNLHHLLPERRLAVQHPTLELHTLAVQRLQNLLLLHIRNPLTLHINDPAAIAREHRHIRARGHALPQASRIAEDDLGDGNWRRFFQPVLRLNRRIRTPRWKARV